MTHSETSIIDRDFCHRHILVTNSEISIIDSEISIIDSKIFIRDKKISIMAEISTTDSENLSQTAIRSSY